MKRDLPVELSAYVKNGGTTLFCEDGEWDLNVVEAAESDFSKELPKSALMIAENGSGDCLFLKRTGGKFSGNVFVFWHEEDRSEVFARSLNKLLESASTPKEASRECGGTGDRIALRELERAFEDREETTLGLSDAMKRLRDGSGFGVEVLPFLRKVIGCEDIISVNVALECIAKLGPAAMKAAEETGGSYGLEKDLYLAGSKVWDYSLFCNSYGDALEAMRKIGARKEVIISYVAHNIGNSNPSFLVRSLKALQEIGAKDAKDLMERAAAFWMPKLNLRYLKEVEKILKPASGK